MSQQPWCLDNNQLTLYCHLQPGAKKSQISGLYNERVKIQIQAPAVDGKANKALIQFLAKQFRIAKSKIVIHKGLNQRTKTVLIDDIQQIPEFLQQLEND
jgi:uncharacterized protein